MGRGYEIKLDRRGQEMESDGREEGGEAKVT